MSTLETQLQTVLDGQIYNDLTEELISARAQAVLLTNEYNASFSQPAVQREGILAPPAWLGGLGSSLRAHLSL
nr:maltose acetyltransferase domain-containing protein [Comamonas testosteroni]